MLAEMVVQEAEGDTMGPTVRQLIMVELVYNQVLLMVVQEAMQVGEPQVTPDSKVAGVVEQLKSVVMAQVVVVGLVAME
jgi:hypothetical protein